MQYCNWFYGPGKTYTDVGEEGVAWEYNDAGDITYTDLIMNNPDGYTVEVAKGLYGGGFLNPGYGSWNSTSAGFSNEQEEACFDVWNSNRDDANLYKTMMTADENASYSAKYNDLRTYVDQVIEPGDRWRDVHRRLGQCSGSNVQRLRSAGASGYLPDCLRPLYGKLIKSCRGTCCRASRQL